MRRNVLIVCLTVVLGLLVSSCGRFANEASSPSEERWISLSKQHTELLYALGVEASLVAVDLSSTYPEETAKLTTVGYHRALSAEAILAVNPTLILHDHGIGPEHVTQQLETLNAPLYAFENSGNTWEGTLALIQEMGDYFQVASRADSIVTAMRASYASLLADRLERADTPKVLVIHFGRATNTYLVMTRKSTGAKMVEWAGGTVPFDGERGMRPLSPEVFASYNPDVILVTNFGYDRLDSREALLDLPGVRFTKAAQEGRIYRIEEHDLVYFGPRTADNIRLIQSFLFDEAS